MKKIFDVSVDVLSGVLFFFVWIACNAAHTSISETFSNIFTLNNPTSWKLVLLVLFLIISSLVGELIKADWLTATKSICQIIGLYFIVATLLKSINFPIDYDGTIIIYIALQTFVAMFLGKKEIE